MTKEILEAVRANINEYDVDGFLKVCLCADIIAFLPGPFRSNAKGLLTFYRVALGQIREQVRYYLLDGEGRYKKVKPAILEALPDWAEGRVAARNVYGLDLESGKGPDEQSDRAFQMYVTEEGTGFVRLVLPVESLLNPEGFVEIASQCLDGLEFISAYGGFALNVRRGYNGAFAGSKLAIASKRYKGIDLGRPLMFADYLGGSLKCVNWLTGIGTSLQARIPDLQKNLPPSTKVIPLQHGILIRATESPVLGDSNRREDLSYYTAVGRVLTRLRIPSELLGPYDGIGGTENTRGWLSRFDGNP